MQPFSAVLVKLWIHILFFLSGRRYLCKLSLAEAVMYNWMILLSQQLKLLACECMFWDVSSHKFQLFHLTDGRHCNIKRLLFVWLKSSEGTLVSWLLGHTGRAAYTALPPNLVVLSELRWCRYFYLTQVRTSMAFDVVHPFPSVLVLLPLLLFSFGTVVSSPMLLLLLPPFVILVLVH